MTPLPLWTGLHCLSHILRWKVSMPYITTVLFKKIGKKLQCGIVKFHIIQYLSKYPENITTLVVCDVFRGYIYGPVSDVNPFVPDPPFPYPLKYQKTLRFPDAFREWKKGASGTNELNGLIQHSSDPLLSGQIQTRVPNLLVWKMSTV